MSGEELREAVALVLVDDYHDMGRLDEAIDKLIPLIGRATLEEAVELFESADVTLDGASHLQNAEGRAELKVAASLLRAMLEDRGGPTRTVSA